jgi:phage-related protein
MADPVKTRNIYFETSQSSKEADRKPLVTRILTLNSYLKTTSLEQKTDPETLQEITTIINDLVSIIGQPVDSKGKPIFFSIENPDEFLEILAQMAENILPEQQISQGEIPTNLAELVDQMEAQIEAEKAARALAEKTGIKVSEARKTVNQFIQEQTSSIEKAVKESTQMSAEEKSKFVPIAKKSVPTLILHQFQDGKTETQTPARALEQIEKISRKGKDKTPPVLIALKQKQESLTNELGRFGSISAKAKTITIRAGSQAIVDQLLTGQPPETRKKIVDHTTACLINTARTTPPKSKQETTKALSTAIKNSARKVDPSIVVEETTVFETVERLDQQPTTADKGQEKQPTVLTTTKTSVEDGIFQALTQISQQPEQISREEAYEQLLLAYKGTDDSSAATILAQSDLVMSEAFGTPAQPKIVISKELIPPIILETLPKKTAPQLWISLEEIEQNTPQDLYNRWFEKISASKDSAEFIAIQVSPEEPITLSNYDPEAIRKPLLFIKERQTESLFTDQNLPQANGVRAKANFLRNLIDIWQEQTISTAVTEPSTTFSKTPSQFFGTPLGQGLKIIGNFFKGKLSPIFKNIGSGIFKKIASTAAGQAIKGVLTKLGAVAIGALSGIATGGLSLLLAAIPAVVGAVKKLARKLGIKLPSLANFARKVLGVSGKGLAGALEAGVKIFAGMTLSTVIIPLAPIIIGVFTVLAFLTILVNIISGGALVQSELGGPGRGTESGIEGNIVDPEGNHLADRAQIAMQACSMNPVTKANCIDPGQKQKWIICLVGEGLSQAEAQDVVAKSCQSAENFETLQCVGYKRAVEPDFPGGHNACWFANSSNQVPKQIDSVQVGDNAVWGSDCCDQCSLGNLGCCGHIGIITKVGPSADGEHYIHVTSAQGGTGNVNTIIIPLEDPTVILRY